MQCLDICKGSVSEAKSAYFWVMGEGKGLKTAPVARWDAHIKDMQAAEQGRRTDSKPAFGSVGEWSSDQEAQEVTMAVRAAQDANAAQQRNTHPTRY